MTSSSDPPAIQSARAHAAVGVSKDGSPILEKNALRSGASGTAIRDGKKGFARMLPNGLGYNFSIICFSSLMLDLSLFNQFNELSESTPYLMYLFIIVCMGGTCHGMSGLLLIVIHLDSYISPWLIRLTIFLLSLSLGTFVFVLVIFGLLHGNLSPTMDLALGTTLTALLVIFYMMLFAAIAVYGRRVVSEEELARAADWGAIVTITMYAIGIGMQCVMLIIGRTAEIPNPWFNLAMIFLVSKLVSSRRRG